MRYFIVLLLACPVWAADTLYQLPPELIQQMFGHQDPNQHVPKRAFDLHELTGLLQAPAFDREDQQSLTQRYLAITYPAGEVAFNDLLQADLPVAVKQTLLSASPAQVRFSGEFSLARFLQGEGAALLESLAEARNVQLGGTLNISEVLTLNSSQYARNPFYGAYTAMSDPCGQAYTLSTAKANRHLLAGFLRQHQQKPAVYRFQLQSCTQSRCRSPAQGDSFASFEFTQFSAYGLNPGDEILARCRYEQIYRRDYTDRSEIEVAFSECQALEVNGAPAPASPLLDDLKRVTP